MADLNYDEGIHYLVTRPVEPIVDDGQGNFNISPIGFPIQDYSGELGVNPTRITPEFIVGYNNLVDSSSRLNVACTANETNMSTLYGEVDIVSTVSSITLVSTTATVTTSVAHGFITGSTITMAGAIEPEYNGDFIITVTSDTTFTYTVSGTPSSPATGVITATYSAQEGDLVLLNAQEIESTNGYYIVELTAWRLIYVTQNLNEVVKVNGNANVNIAVGSTPTFTFNVDTITSVTIGTGKVFAEVTLTEESNFATGNSITIASATVTGYNGTYDIQRISSLKFKYEISSALGDDTSGTATAAYTVADGDLVNLIAQTTETENGIYVARSASAWELYGVFYEWDGTENDNVVGEYDDLDSDGNPVNHYRKGYSLEETAGFLKDRLETQLEFGQYKGSQRPLRDHGAFVRWLMSGRKVNVGGAGKSKNVFVDGFGLGDPSEAKNDRTQGPVDPTDETAVSAKRAEISNLNRSTVWGLTNHHSNALAGFFNKSPFVKDYPFIYNSEYQSNDPYSYLTGGHLPVDVDAERWRLTATGTATSTDTEVRPLTIDTLWYHRDNSYHNNVTLDLTSPNMFGGHSMSIVNNFDKPDHIVLLEQDIDDTSITTGSPGTVTLPDGTKWMEGDYVQITPADGATLPTGLAEYTTYKVASGYPSGNDIQLTDLSGTPINITTTGSGNFVIQRHVFDPYNNNEVVDALDDLVGITFNSGLSLVHKVTEGTVTKYYICPRAKGSLSLLIAKGTGWDYDTLTYDNTGANDINIYLESTETDYITYSHPTFSTDDLRDELDQHNDMIPVLFDPATTDIDSLTCIFVDNSIVDYTDSVNDSNKVRSKKTFIHLPTPMGLADGTPCEIDVSLPVVPETDSFPFNTVGSLSGYRNYVSQPRVYVFSGYQSFNCDNLAITSIEHTSGDATITLTSDHNIYTSTFDDSNIDVDTDQIAVTNWKDISVGDIVRFKNDGGSLPTATPAITAATDYVVTEVKLGRIRISDSLGTHVDITAASGGGTHSIVVQSPLRFKLRNSTDNYYNDEFDGYVYDFDKIKFTVLSTAASPATGPVIIDRVITVSGSNGVKGLSERNNASVFSPMPEVEFAEDGNVYHQSFSPDNIIGNGLAGEYRDIRTLVATVYPTSTSTFAWRIDNSPRVRMLQWSLMNVNALGGTANTGSFANVAYDRNKEIFNEFPSLFSNGSDGVFSVYDNPLSYVDTTDPSMTEQHINAFVRIRYPDVLTPSSSLDLLSEEDVSTVGSFNYQAASAYRDLISDFHKGRVLVESNNENLDVYQSSLTDYDGVTATPLNHASVVDIPPSFFNTGDPTTDFMDFTAVESINGSVDYDAYQRWITKHLYVPEYIVDADGNTFLTSKDAFGGVSSTLKDYINEYYYDEDSKSSTTHNRYITDVLNPIIDQEFEFGAGSENRFVDYLVNLGTISDTDIDDVRRRLWDSAFKIPDASERKFQNAYHLTSTGATFESTVKFNGSSWIPFAKLFSTDNVAPSENVIEDITDYATIIGGGYSAVDNTLNNALSSNLIAERFKQLGYTDSFVSVNTIDSTDSDKEEFLRNFVTGYSNRLPYRFYNGFKIAVAGTTDSTQHATDISSILVDTESDVDRIYTYSVKDYLTDYITTPSSESAQYLNDNFALSELSGNTSELPLYEIIESGYVPENPAATLYLWNWPSLDGWTRQTNDYHIEVGVGQVDDGRLMLDTGTNPMYRYDETIPDNFVTESYIYTSDDQLLAFITHEADASEVNFHTVINSTYAVVAFEDSPLGTWPDPSSNGIYLHFRKDGSPIDMSTAATTMNDYTAMNTIRVGTYVPNRLYRVLFARMSNNDFMVQVYDTTTNTEVGSVSVNVLFPNVLGVTEDSMDFVLSVGRQNYHTYAGYFDKQSYASGLTDSEVLRLFGIADDNVYAHDLNPSWWYFEEGNPTEDPDNSKILDMVTVSGMNHIADREFYRNKMQYNYTRVKMSFVFSEKLGRWLPMDYRQAPTSYLTPTFGATALKERERSIVEAGTTGSELTDYVSYLQPDVSNETVMYVYGTTQLIRVGFNPIFSVGDTIAIHDDGSVNSFNVTVSSLRTISFGLISIYIYSLASVLPSNYEVGTNVLGSVPINTLVTGEYPINLLTGIESVDYLWKHPVCLDPQNMFRQLSVTGYWEMAPMNLNPFCLPYLSSEFPYDNDGDLKPELDYTYDPAGSEAYRFTRLIEPNMSSPDEGINFVVPNNVHGGEIDADNTLMLYQPNMWNVHWHMRPAVCAMDGCDIPSPTERTGGVMADPVLNSMYCYPDARDPQYYVPWHEDMNVDWLNSAWLLIDARIDDETANPERDLYNEIDARIDGDVERNDYWEIESGNVSASEREDAITDLE